MMITHTPTMGADLIYRLFGGCFNSENRKRILKRAKVFTDYLKIRLEKRL